MFPVPYINRMQASDLLECCCGGAIECGDVNSRIHNIYIYVYI